MPTPATPLTRETAKVGQTYTAPSGVIYKVQESPYSAGATISVAQNLDANGKVIPAVTLKPKAPVQKAAQPAAPVVAPVAGAPPAPAPATAPEPVAWSPPPGDNIEDDHRSELAQRQTAADLAAQDLDAFHAQRTAAMNAPPAPAPTIDQPKIMQAGAGIPDSAMGDIGRGLFNAPAEALEGARTAVRNLLDFSDHIGDLVEEHIPTTLSWTGYQHHLDANGNVVDGGDGKNHFAFGTAADLAARGFSDARPGAALDKVAPANTAIPHSVTGDVIKNVSQFATGMVGAGKVLGPWKWATKGGLLVKSMAEGAISDFAAFDAHQQRLSDLLKDHVPDAIKPVFEYLSSDPRDGETEGRFKNALEGLGLGVAAQSVMAGARALRAARMTQRAAAIQATNEGLQGLIDAPHTAVVAEAETFAKDVKAAVGDPAQDGFVIKRKFPLTPQEVAANAEAGEMGPNTIGLNYAKISDETDMQAAAVQFYDAFHPEIMDAKRGVQSIDQQIDDAFGADVSKLLGQWTPGTAMASHELTALRFAQAAAARDFLAHARLIAAGDASLARQAAFLQTGGVLDALTRAVEGGKAEAARTLRTLRETVPSMVGSGHTSAEVVEFYRKVDALVAGAGGKEMVERAAKAFLTTAQRNPLGASKFLRGLKWYGKFADGTKEVLNVFMTNGLLSVAGNAANIAGNASALVWETMSRAAAPVLSSAVGVESHIAPGEARQMMVGMTAAVGDIFRLSDHLHAGTDWKAHLGLFNLDKAKANTKAFAGMVREEVAAAIDKPKGIPGLGDSPENDTALGRLAKLVWSATKPVVTIPGKLNGLMDDATKIIAGRAELHAQSYRRAMQDVDSGLITADQVGVQMQKYLEDPSAETLEKVIAAQKELSWTRDDGQFAKSLGGLRTWMNSIPTPLPLGTSIIPFIRTPANVFSYGMRSSAFAPLSPRWYSEMLSADGATRQLALTKYATGSLLTLWAMDQVAAGQITGGGPADPAQKQALARVDPLTGEALWQPYSVRIGDRWFDYSRLDPAATPLSVAADVSEGWLGNDWTNARAEGASEVFASGAMNIGSSFMNKSTSQGIAQLMEAMAQNAQGNPGASETFMEKRAVSALPFSSVLGSARKAFDPNQREVNGILDAFKNDIPGLSKDLPQSFDLWGNARTYESGMGTVYDTVIPSRTHLVGGQPADREMLRLGYAKAMPAKSISLGGGLTANLRNYPTIYNEILIRGGRPALQEINDLVSGASPNSPYYFSLADGSDQNAPSSKARYLKNRLDFYFSRATQSVKQDFADELRQIATDQAGRKAEARSGQ